MKSGSQAMRPSVEVVFIYSSAQVRDCFHALSPSLFAFADAHLRTAVLPCVPSPRHLDLKARALLFPRRLRTVPWRFLRSLLLCHHLNFLLSAKHITPRI